jgi:deoxyribodipyrimidine photo-lyase
MVNPARILELNDQPERPAGDYVLYWMQSAQRTSYNHALEYAIARANELGRPPLVFFGLTDCYPSANIRHFRFMLEGLQEVQRSLEERNIAFVLWRIDPFAGAAELARDACMVITDDAHLPFLREWRSALARQVRCRMYEVATNLIVPVHIASEKEEFSAGTFRPRVTRLLPGFLKPLRHTAPKHRFKGDMDCCEIEDIPSLLPLLAVDRTTKPTNHFHGGASYAKLLLNEFLKSKLQDYGSGANDPTRDCLSNMSPYLHFGQISSLEIALAVSKEGGPSAADYLEELIVRRELAHNFTRYNPKAATYEGLPPWCRRTLEFHAADERQFVYSLPDFENARTHDPYWNAAQREMVLTGKMHGYMRMYWGKKILEWTTSPEDAFRIALHLNDKHELDGRDANGITGVAWCLGKHDRPWSERPVFGKIRYMNAAGLKRKFNADRYVEMISRLEPATPSAAKG